MKVTSKFSCLGEGGLYFFIDVHRKKNEVFKCAPLNIKKHSQEGIDR